MANEISWKNGIKAVQNKKIKYVKEIRVKIAAKK